MYCNSRIRQTQLSSKIGNEDDVIDAIVEEKTAGLALDDDEENTSVRYDQISLLAILYISLFMFLHECFTYWGIDSCIYYHRQEYENETYSRIHYVT